MDVSVLEVGRGVGIGLDGTGCERVKITRNAVYASLVKAAWLSMKKRVS